MSGKTKTNQDKMENFVKNEIDDFWDDCIYNEAAGKAQDGDSVNQFLTFSDTNSKRIYKNSEADKNKDRYLHLIKKYQFESQVSPEEIQNKKKEENKKKKSMERCYLMYEKGKIKNEINKIIYHKNEELKVQNELKACTWKPKLCKPNKEVEDNLRILTKGTKIYNRSMQWKFKNNQKIGRSKSDMHRELSEYTFKPIINTNPNLTEVFADERTIFKDDSNKNFVYRYEKTRKDEDDKMKRLTPDLSKTLKHKWTKYNMVRSSSIGPKESELYRQTLHEELHSMKYNIDTDYE